MPHASGENNMTIIDFFDEYNVEHLAAYKHLSETGSWPESFIPDNCEITPSWPYHITSKMANAYVQLGIEGHILGMPPYDT